MNENNIFPIQSDFERIKKQNENGSEYWTSRELCTALGYSTYQKFNRTLNKAIAIANKKGCNTTEHFNATFEMVKLNSGSFRKVKNIHLSRIACLMIVENADSKKPQVQMAREYFKQEISTPE
ncbi:BRO family protein, partial [Xylanibacter rodentium]